MDLKFIFCKAVLDCLISLRIVLHGVKILYLDGIYPIGMSIYVNQIFIFTHRNEVIRSLKRFVQICR